MDSHIKNPKIAPVTLRELKEIYHKWLYFTDEEVIDIVLATALGEHLPGDPLWLFLIAPPGGCKTELLRSFSNSNFFYHLSNLTPRTFISGFTVGKGKERKKIEDLLPQLNKKILIFKDFTTILEKSREQRSEIIAQLREIYDGSFSYKCGNLDEVIRYDSRFGLVAGVTPVVDKYWKVMQQLGERFLKVRWVEDSMKTAERSRENEGKEIQMRDEVKDGTMNFMLNQLMGRDPAGRDVPRLRVAHFDDKKYGKELLDIALFIAICRTPVSIQSYQTEFYHDYIPSPEQPTRLAKQLKKLAKSLALVRHKLEVNEEEIGTLRRIARDTVPQERLAVLEVVHRLQRLTLQGCPRKAIIDAINMPDTSIIRVLQQLVMLELIKETVIEEREYSTINRLVFYRLNQDLRYPLTFFVETKKVREPHESTDFTYEKVNEAVNKDE